MKFKFIKNILCWPFYEKVSLFCFINEVWETNLKSHFLKYYWRLNCHIWRRGLYYQRTWKCVNANVNRWVGNIKVTLVHIFKRCPFWNCWSNFNRISDEASLSWGIEISNGFRLLTKMAGMSMYFISVKLSLSGNSKMDSLFASDLKDSFGFCVLL